MSVMKQYGKLLGRIRRLRQAMLDHAYLMTLLAALAVVAASAVYTRSLDARGAEQAAAQAHEIASPQPALQPTATAVVLRPAATMAPLRTGGAAVRPVSGGVLRDYDRERHVFWEALACYRPHAALDLAGEAGESVLCAKDGVVARTARDDLWGWRVEVEQTDGRLAVYAGLLLCYAQEGQSVTRGQALGELLDRIPCEAELGAHVHLELWEDGAAVDPAGMLPQGAGN